MPALLLLSAYFSSLPRLATPRPASTLRLPHMNRLLVLRTALLAGLVFLAPFIRAAGASSDDDEDKKDAIGKVLNLGSRKPKPEIAEKVPMKRIGHVEEIAKTAAFLLSEGAGYITGQNIRVDGGLTRAV